MMSAIELSTAAREGLPVKFFVLDDGVYTYMQKLQIPAYRRTTATVLARLDYAALAASMGLAFNEIGSNADASSGIARALAMPGPVLTRVCISYEGRDVRWLSAVKRAYLDHVDGRQKARMLTRVTARSIVRPKDSD